MMLMKSGEEDFIELACKLTVHKFHLLQLSACEDVCTYVIKPQVNILSIQPLVALIGGDTSMTPSPRTNSIGIVRFVVCKISIN